MFLLYVSDIGAGKGSRLKFFANDCLLYRVMGSDKALLQKGAHTGSKFRLSIAKKYYVMRSTTFIIKQAAYIISAKVDHNPNLGVEIFNDQAGKSTSTKMAVKATSTLPFLRWNPGRCIGPHLKYGASVWDPSRQCQIEVVEMVQCRRSRFATEPPVAFPEAIQTQPTTIIILQRVNRI